MQWKTSTLALLLAHFFLARGSHFTVDDESLTVATGEENVVFTRREPLGRGMTLFFTVEEADNIVDFALLSEEVGWLGMGFNEQLMMKGADAVIGWGDADASGRSAYINEYKLHGYTPDSVQVSTDNELGLVSDPSIISVGGKTLLRFRKRHQDHEAYIIFARGKVPENDHGRLVHSFKGIKKLTLSLPEPPVVEIPNSKGLQKLRKLTKKRRRNQKRNRDNKTVARKRLHKEQSVFIPAGTVIPEPDYYMCNTFKASDSLMSIFRFEPLEPEPVIHHTIIRKCKGLKHPVGEAITCKDMMASCEGGEMMYVWAVGAGPGLDLGSDVAAVTGSDVDFPYIGIEVHFTMAWPQGLPGDVGVTLGYKTEFPDKWMDVSILANGYFVVPGSTDKHDVGVECMFRGNSEVTVFRSRVHAHAYGTKVTGTINGKTFMSRSPQEPQVFAEVEEFVIQPGDVLTATCSYNTAGQPDDIPTGEGAAAEMCNLYLMHYSDVHGAFVCQAATGFAADIPWIEWKQGREGKWVSVYEPAPIAEVPAEHPSSVLENVHQVTGIDRVETEEGSQLISIFHRANRTWGGPDDWTFEYSEDGDWKWPIYKKDEIPLETVAKWEISESKQDSDVEVHKFAGGKQFMPHGLTQARDGSVWVTDVASHQVYRYSAEGDLLLELGEKLVPGRDKEHFCMPTDTIVTITGNVVVADGYCNTRLVEFSPDGVFVREIPLPQFGQHSVLPHSITYDPSSDVAYVADRENGLVLSVPLSLLQRPTVRVEFAVEEGGRAFAADYSSRAGGIMAVLKHVGRNSTLEVYQQNADARQAKWGLVVASEVMVDTFLHDLDLHTEVHGDTVMVTYLVSGWTNAEHQDTPSPVIRQLTSSFTVCGHSKFPTEQDRFTARGADAFLSFDDTDLANLTDKLLQLVGDFERARTYTDNRDIGNGEGWLATLNDMACSRDGARTGADFEEVSRGRYTDLAACEGACMHATNCTAIEATKSSCTVWYGDGCKLYKSHPQTHPEGLVFSPGSFIRIRNESI